MWAFKSAFFFFSVKFYDYKAYTNYLSETIKKQFFHLLKKVEIFPAALGTPYKSFAYYLLDTIEQEKLGYVAVSTGIVWIMLYITNKITF